MPELKVQGALSGDNARNRLIRLLSSSQQSKDVREFGKKELINRGHTSLDVARKQNPQSNGKLQVKLLVAFVSYALACSPYAPRQASCRLARNSQSTHDSLSFYKTPVTPDFVPLACVPSPN